MLEKIPSGVGHALRHLRAGFEKIVGEDDEFAAVITEIDLFSPAFPAGGQMPARFTADGEGMSPPLAWGPPPANASSLVLIVEDPDAPAPAPLTHLIAWGLSPDEHELAEGAFDGPHPQGGSSGVGRNAFFRTGWLPPDPPSGHGIHHYVFQLFALDCRLTFDRPPTRSTLVEAISGHVLARGELIATYERP